MVETVEDLREEVAYLQAIIVGLTGQGEQPIAGLTRLQSRIVRTLEQGRGRAISRQAIFEGIYWNRPDGGPVCDKILDAHICYLRKRRPDIGKRIHNAFGFGWAMES